MNEQELGKEIAKLLDFSANEALKQSTLYRLQSARRAALENCQPTLEIINSGNGASVYGGHEQQFNVSKLILVLIALFAFALVSASYWQFLGKNRSAMDTTLLVDDISKETYSNDDYDLDNDLTLDTYIDNVRKLVDDFSTDDIRIDDEVELEDSISTDAHLEDNESDLGNDSSIEDARIDDEPVLEKESVPTEVRIDNELEEWLGSNK
jgi:hypothetical protein